MENVEKKFKAFLATKGLKLTKERKIILKRVFATHSHFNAHKLVSEFKNKISRATVYRTLNLLAECNFIGELKLGEGKRIYEHILGHTHHDHLFCLYCGKTIEFDNERIEK